MFNEHQFIGREDWLERFKTRASAAKGSIWHVSGQPGIGKSTLLGHFEHLCTLDERPNIWLDLESTQAKHGLDILAGMAGSAKFFDAEKSNKSTKEKIGEGYKTISSGLVGALELGKDLIPGGALAAGTAKVLLVLGEGIAGKAAQISEDAAVAHPELYLLDALAAAGGRTNKPVLLVDTYEHILRNDFVIKSRLMLSYGNARENTEKEILLSSWLSSLFSYLEAKGWCIVVAGRDTASRTPDRLPSFNRAEMLKAAMSRPDLTQYLPQQEDAIATVLSILSFDGNPLWLQVAMNLLENLLAEGKDLEDLAQQPDYLQECFEEVDPFDTGMYDGIEFGRCKLSLIKTLTHHIAGLEDQAWKIALPRVLDKGIVKQLFAPEQANAIIHNFKIAGVFRTTGAEFSLHEEIRDLLLAYARDKGWLNSEDTRALHGKLWEYLNAFYIGKLPHELRDYISREGIARIGLEKDRNAALVRVTGELTQHISLNWILDACYHRVMAQDSYHGVSADEFWNGLSGSISLGFLEKWRVSDSLPTFSQYQVEGLMKAWRDETDKFINLLPKTQQVDLDSYKAWRELSKKRRGGDLDLMLASIPFWIERVEKFPTPNNYYCLARSHQNSEKYTQAIELYDQVFLLFQASDGTQAAEVCAKALYDKGLTLRNKLDNPQAAVDTYDQLIQRFGDADVPAIQEQCAMALVNKGWTLGSQLDNPQAAVDTYDQLIQRFGNSEVPAIQEWCAKALFNKGVTLGRLDRIPEAMTCYEQLLDRYSNSELLAIQELCLSAVANMVEPLLVLGQTEAATQRIHQVMKQVDESNQMSVIMPYLLWLAEPEVGTTSVITAISNLSPDLELNWFWGDIQPFIKELPNPRKSQAESFISFFEAHQDLARLESELKAAES